MVMDLRERLARLYLYREYDGDEDTALCSAHPGVQEACYEHADAALPLVAAWLRAEAQLAIDTWPDNTDREIAAALHGLADAIDPQPERTAP